MVFRSGALEAVASSLARGHQQRFLILPKIQTMIVEYACLYTNALSACGIQPPLAVFAGLLDVEGRELLHGPIVGGAFPEDLPSGTLTRARLQFKECIFDSMPTDDQECAQLLRPILDHVANAAGLTTSPCFDAAGNYTPARDV
jgi:hypothetical protein